MTIRYEGLDYTYHYDLVVVLWGEDLQLLVLEKLEVALAICVVSLVTVYGNKSVWINVTAYLDLLARVPGLPPGTSHSVVVSLSAVLQQAPIF